MFKLITVHEILAPPTPHLSMISTLLFPLSLFSSNLSNPTVPRHYLLTALLYMPKGLFCQIPHRSQSARPFPYRSPNPPGFQSSLSCNLIPLPTPRLWVHPSPPSIYQSLFPFLHHGRLVDLPASPQCGCISVPCCALCGVGFLATDNSHDRAPGQREPLCFFFLQQQQQLSPELLIFIAMAVG